MRTRGTEEGEEWGRRVGKEKEGGEMERGNGEGTSSTTQAAPWASDSRAH